MTKFSEDLNKFIFGDSEIDLVSFAGDGVRLNFNDQDGKPMAVLDFQGVEYILIESNHMQNVISSISVFDSVDELLRFSPAKIFCQSKNAELLTNKNLSAAYIRPISGFEAVILFTEGNVLSPSP
ncbi:hypothetical protein [Methylobacterium fujisawaense]|jgi:hypothetical protein